MAQPVLVVAADRPKQRIMENSWQRAHNVYGALELQEGREICSHPVLLVDDVVDSRWTFAVADFLLRGGGSGVVWPLALADASVG